jgi:hypothetical protein
MRLLLSNDINNLIAEKNDLHNPEFNMLRKFNIKFNPLQLQGGEKSKIVTDDYQLPDESFSRKVKTLINAVIIEGRTWFVEFNKLMQ